MERVFISHVAEDGTLAVQLAQGLEDAGYPTWYYERDSLPGPSYLDQILHALDRSAAGETRATTAALGSWQVDKEIVQAHERGRPFLPLLHGLSYEQVREQRPAWVMAFGAAVALPLSAAHDVAAVLPQILAGLRWLMGDTAATAAEPAATKGAPAAASRIDTLPIPPTPLLGREREVASLCGLLRRPEVRLVTLTGTGGVGKTHLSMQVAENLREHFGDGVFFVALAPLRDPTLVVATVAQVLGVAEAGRRPLIEILSVHLYGKHVLLVLDNFEHLLAAAPTVADLLARCRGLKLLVTSRALLHLRGEHEVVVSPLPQEAAVALFIQRMQAAQANFTLTEASAAIVAQICRQLDGLPLAIELAAARTKLFSLPTLLKRLAHRLPLLVGGPRDLPERQQTLRATLDWSYDLLASGEQALFRRLGVFVGGCSLQAAEAVCALEYDRPGEVPEGLATLVDQSLLRQEEQADGELRLMMLETIREYGLERLEAHGEATPTRRAHAVYYMELAEEAEQALHGVEQASWLTRLEREHDNLRAALQWAGDTSEQELAWRLASALWLFWETHGHLSEGRRWLTHLPPLPEQLSEVRGAALRAKAQAGASVLAYSQGDFAYAAELAEEGLGWARRASNQRAAAVALMILTAIAYARGERQRVMDLAKDGLAAAFLAFEGRTNGISAILLSLEVLVARDQGDRERATALATEGLAVARQVGHAGPTSLALTTLALVAYDSGEYSQAIDLAEESVTTARSVGHKRYTVHALYALVLALRSQGQYERMLVVAEEALVLLRELGDALSTLVCLAALVVGAGMIGQFAVAARIDGLVEVLCEERGLPRPAEADYHAAVATAREALGETGFAVARAGVQEYTLDQAIAEALGILTDLRSAAGSRPTLPSC